MFDAKYIEMAKHIYDKEGNYTGKILSEEEHRKKLRGGGSSPFRNCKGCEKMFWKIGTKGHAKVELLIDDGSWYTYCGKCLPHWYYSSRFVLIWIILFFPIGLYGLYYRIANSLQIKKWRKNNKVEKITVHSNSILDTLISVNKFQSSFRFSDFLKKE